MSSESPRESSYDLEEKGAGWLVFSALILGFAGILGVIDGITASTKAPFYETRARYVFSGSTTWGWFMIIVGSVTILAAVSILRGDRWARIFGIGMAGLQAITHLLAIQSYPFWSLSIFALDILVIYGLAVYGGRRVEV